MSRMHSRGRGSSGSTHPVNPNVDWVDMDDDEIEDTVNQLADEGKEPSEIGRILRDEYDVPSVNAVTGRKLVDLMNEEHTDGFPEDIRRLMRKAISINEHLEKNPNDDAAKRRLGLTEAKIRRLADYYRGDEIPADWKYNIETARLVVE